MALRIGIDIGTSGIRIAALNQQDRLVCMSRRPHEPGASIDAMAWYRGVIACLELHLQELLSLGYDPQTIQALAIDGTSGSLVLVDENINPVTPALLYNTGDFQEEAEIIARFAPSEHITRGANSALARALRLVSLDTEKKAVHLTHQADFIAARLMRKAGYSDFNNCLKTGFEPSTNSWPEWLEEIGINPCLLPKVVPAGTQLGRLDADIAKHLGLSPHTQVYAGTTDSVAAFLAAAPFEQGVAVTSLGTTLAIKMLCPKRVDVPQLGIYSHRLGEHWLVGCALKCGAGLLQKCFSLEELEALSQDIDASQASDLDAYLQSKGQDFSLETPFWLLEEKQKLHSDLQDDGLCLQYLLESIARVEQYYYDKITNYAGCRLETLFTAGGGAKNPVWTKMRERILGIAISTSQHTEAAIGAARLIQTQA